MIPVGTDLERRRMPWVTLTLVLASTAVFLLEVVLPEQALAVVFRLLGFSPASIVPVSAFSHMFLHGDLFHLVFNMLFLWVFGGPVEERVGGRAYALYYFSGGLVAGLFFLGTQWIAHPDAVPGPLIGASGAISTVIALYLYRCHSSKVRLMVSPVLLSHRLDIPAAPLLLFWFGRDLFFGLSSMTDATGVAYWAHVGGFLFGLAVGRVRGYGREGRIEHLRARVQEKLERGGGWAGAEKELKKLLAVSGGDPEVHHDLARLYRERKEAVRAARHYRLAVQRFLGTSAETAGFVLLEYLEGPGAPMPPAIHLKAAEGLARAGHYGEACAVLRVFDDPEMCGGAVGERSLALRARLERHLGREEEARRSVGRLLEAFPESRYRDLLRKTLETPPGAVFRPPAAGGKEDSPRDAAVERELREQERLGWIARAENLIADPVFWAILLFLHFAVPFFFGRSLLAWGFPPRALPVLYFGLAVGMTLLHRAGSVSDLLSASGPSEKRVRREAACREALDRARRAEREERLEDAARDYEAYLRFAPGDIQARFSLARIYVRMGRSGMARKHFQGLLENAAPDHPFFREATEALSRLKGAS